MLRIGWFTIQIRPRVRAIRITSEQDRQFRHIVNQMVLAEPRRDMMYRDVEEVRSALYNILDVKVKGKSQVCKASLVSDVDLAYAEAKKKSLERRTRKNWREHGRRKG